MLQENTQKDPSNEYQDRLAKLTELREMGIQPYPDSFERTHLALEAKELGEKGLRETEEIMEKPKSDMKLCGRLMSFRSHGKISFGQLQDKSGRIQICFMKNVLGDDPYKLLKKIDVADFIGVEGELFLTKHGEITLMVTEYTLLSKTLRPLPEKFHGLKDQESQYRQRYLDLTMNSDTKKRFDIRSQFIRALREFYWKHDFKEIETPVLSSSASGALAKPFSTHHEALDHDFFLRIAGGETYLKEAIGGGYEKVFEIGKVFRNEGMDPSHLQEFTMNEFYHAYWNYENLMKFTEEMFEYLIKETMGTLEVDIQDRDGNVQKVNFKGPWKRVSMRDAVKDGCGIDIEKFATASDLLKEIKSKKIAIEDADKLGRGNLIDHLYKKVARPKMIGPIFLIQHPTDLSPLSRRNDDNADIVDRFQLVVNGWEIVNAYSELVDPVEQAKAFKDQSEAQEKGDEEAHGKDDEFVLAMEHGFPPTAGWGMGIDRIVALLTQQDNLKDVVMFPLLRPLLSNLNNIVAEEVSKNKELPDENSKRFIAILNKKVDTNKLMNALGHITAGLSGGYSDPKEFSLLQYQDKDGGVHPNISHFPFIVLKADNSNKIRKARKECFDRNIPFSDFTSTMTIGKSKDQMDATKKSPEEELEYFGIVMFGTTKELKEFTGKFSLF